MSILINTISNSIKFSRSGGSVSIVIRKLVISRAHLIKITILDSGIGIPAEIKSRLFQLDSEQQSSNPDETSQHGIGIGLTFSKMVTQKLGPYDYIKVRSTVGKGTKLSLFL